MNEKGMFLTVCSLVLLNTCTCLILIFFGENSSTLAYKNYWQNKIRNS